MANNASPAFVDFRAVKAAVTMEQVLTHYELHDRFTRSGDSLSGPCPIHGGSNPTQFRVSTSKNVWNCFGDCQGGGNVLDFVCRMENIAVRDAANRLAEWFNLPQARQERSRREALGAMFQQELMRSVSAPDDPSQLYRRDAWTVAAMIAEDADCELILATVDELALQPEEVQDFLVAFRLSMLTLPVPWYRPDIPKLVEEVCQRVTEAKE